jgi:hypothetical protein
LVYTQISRFINRYRLLNVLVNSKRYSLAIIVWEIPCGGYLIPDNLRELNRFAENYIPSTLAHPSIAVSLF